MTAAQVNPAQRSLLVVVVVAMATHKEGAPAGGSSGGGDDDDTNWSPRVPMRVPQSFMEAQQLHGLILLLQTLLDLFFSAEDPRGIDDSTTAQKFGAGAFGKTAIAHRSPRGCSINDVDNICRGAPRESHGAVASRNSMRSASSRKLLATRTCSSQKHAASIQIRATTADKANSDAKR